MKQNIWDFFNAIKNDMKELYLPLEFLALLLKTVTSKIRCQPSALKLFQGLLLMEQTCSVCTTIFTLANLRLFFWLFNWKDLQLFAMLAILVANNSSRLFCNFAVQYWGTELLYADQIFPSLFLVFEFLTHMIGTCSSFLLQSLLFFAAVLICNL